METIDDNIKLGCELLDQTMPDWYAHISLDNLHMSCGHSCILGQLYGDYFEGERILGINGARYGFETMMNSSDTSREEAAKWGHLTRKWKKEIRARLYPDSILK